jgi:hypothetical protein
MGEVIVPFSKRQLIHNQKPVDMGGERRADVEYLSDRPRKPGRIPLQ